MDEDLSNVQVVVLAAYALGADVSPVDSEDIAIKANEIAPGRFVWRKYPRQIRLEHVRVYLSDAKKARNGCLMGGDGTKGWHLTRAGSEWARAHKGLISGVLAGRERLDRKSEKARSLERDRLLQLPAWRKFHEGHAVSRREAEAVFRLSEYSAEDRRRLLVNRICSLFADDGEIRPFVEAMSELVGRKEEQHE